MSVMDSEPLSVSRHSLIGAAGVMILSVSVQTPASSHRSIQGRRFASRSSVRNGMPIRLRQPQRWLCSVGHCVAAMVPWGITERSVALVTYAGPYKQMVAAAFAKSEATADAYVAAHRADYCMPRGKLKNVFDLAAMIDIAANSARL